MLKRTNIQEKLDAVRAKTISDAEILIQVKAIFKKDTDREQTILNKLSSGNTKQFNTFNTDLLDAKRIFHKNHIKKICVDYRLRFLDSSLFKGDYPQRALDEIKYLENTHQTQLEEFKIIAPSKMFILYKTDDPLLFAPIGNDYYYLIHKWGNDLHPFRKLIMWPYKRFENLVVAIFLVSILCTMLIPDGLLSKEQSSQQDIMVFLFIFKSVAAIVLYYAFAQGKNFNTVIWNSKYDKSR